MTTAPVIFFVLVAVVLAFAISASAGFGGSLILVPALALVLGTKPGTALAALLLAANNVVKVIAYRESLPLRKATLVVVLVGIGAALGALLLVAASERAVAVAVVVGFVVAFTVERLDLTRLRRLGAPVLAFASGATSGFSGTSGPLKGLALRNLELDRFHLVGGLSIASLAGDAVKTGIWTDAALLDGGSYVLAAACVPLMVGATLFGQRLNRTIGERSFAGLFWIVMAGYTTRLVAGL